MNFKNFLDSEQSDECVKIMFQFQTSGVVSDSKVNIIGAS